MQDDSAEHLISKYIAAGAAEGALAAAMKLSKALEVGLDEVLDAVREIGQPAAALAGGGSLVVGTAAASAAGVASAAGTALNPTVVTVDGAAAIDALTVIRRAEVNEVTGQASRGGLARLNANQRILAAVVLVAAIYPVLPPRVQEWLLEEANLVTAIATVLGLLKG